MKLNMPDELYTIAEPEAAAQPTEQSATQTMVPRERSWRDLMQRMEQKQRQERG